MSDFLLCCDWGTTSFRLRRVRLSDQKIEGEIQSDDGIADTFQVWKRMGGNQSRKVFFLHVLKCKMDELSESLGLNVSNLPIVISGMASSSIGLMEVPYATVPFRTDGSTVTLETTTGQPVFNGEIFVIGGVKTSGDVMRGEETQLVGLAGMLGLFGNYAAILPGTHSKHLFIENGQLTRFHTYMTGELFSTLSMHTILRDSVAAEDSADAETEREAFLTGVRDSGQAGILRSLFRVRTNQLFNKYSKRENSRYLSGLLIGSELRNLELTDNRPIVLCGSSAVQCFYQWGMEELDLPCTAISPELVDEATVRGQVIIFESYVQSSAFMRRS